MKSGKKISFGQNPKEHLLFFREAFLNNGGGLGIPILYVKFWWPLFFAMKIIFSFSNLATGLGNIPKKKYFFYYFPYDGATRQSKTR